jgi:flagellar hook-associated protein 3 FlgL
MISSLDPASQLFLADVGRVQQRLADVNRKITTGTKISDASDAPDQVEALLQLRADRQRNQQVGSNLSLALTGAQTADDTLASAIKVMDRALVLASQGANSSMDAAGRQSLAQEVQSLQDQMLAFSRTTVQGLYIFSGDHPGSPAYASDPSTPAGVLELQSAQATRTIQDASGQTFVASETAQQIFDLRDSSGAAVSGNVFDALSQLYTALTTGDAQAVGQTVDAIKKASDHLNTMEAFYGTVETRIQSAQSFSSKLDTQLQIQLSQIQDADVTSDALELTKLQTQVQSAFQMEAAMPRKTLFEFLG